MSPQAPPAHACPFSHNRLQPRLRSLCGDDDVVLNLESEAGEKLEACSESLHEQAKELILLGAPGEGAVGAVAHTLTMVEPFVLPREHPAGCKDELDTVTRWGMRAVTDLSPGTLLGMYLGDYATGEELDAYQAAQKKNQIRVLRRLEEAREHCIAGPIPKRSAEEDMVILDCLLELPHKLRIGKNEDDSLMVNAAPQPGPDGHRAKTIGALYNDARGFQPRRRPNCVFISAVRGRDVPCGLGAPEGMHLPLLFVVVCEDMVAGEECLISYGGARYWKRLEEMCAVKQAVIQLERGEKVRANPLFYKRKIRKLFEDDKWYDGEVRGSGTRYECVSLAPPPPHPLRDELNTPHSSWYRVYYHADAATEDMSLSELLEVLEDE